MMFIRTSFAALSMVVLLTACHRRIPSEYEYPAGWVTAEHPLLQTKSLEGRVVDPRGAPMQWVLVESMTPDFKKRLAATLTNEKGEFRLRVGAGKYYLRFRYRGFNDYLVPVVVKKSSPSTLVVELELSD